MKIAGLLLLAGHLLAQPPTASLRGTLADPSGAAVPNINIALAQSPNPVRTSRTDATGHYQFAGLAPGLYTIRVTVPGFAPFEAPRFEIAQGRTQTFDIALTLLTQAEQVTVTATDTTKLDTDPSNNAGALVLSGNDLDALPDDPDDLAADLQALAGPAAGPGGGQFFVDGFTGGRLPPKSSIREIRVNQNPFAAQYDKPGQGRIEIFTKPGADDYRGELIFQFSDAALNSRNPFVSVRPPFQRRQWEGELAGPVNRKTSFRFDFERRDIEENAFINAVTLDSSLNVAPLTLALATPLSNAEMNLRVDRQLSASHTLTGRYTYARDSAENQGAGGFSLPDTVFNGHGSEDTLQLAETGILSAQAVNETRFRFRRQRNSQSGGTQSPITSVPDAFTTGGSSQGDSFNHQNRYELQNFTSRVSGAHTLRWGGLMRGVTISDQAAQNYAGTFTFTSLAAYRTTLLGLRNGFTDAQIRASGGGASQFTRNAGDPLANLGQFDFGFFAQDDWRIRPGVALSFGLRYEFQTHSGDRRDIAPRVGLAWAVGRNAGKSPKNVIRAGVGMFYERLGEGMTLQAERQNGIRQQNFLIPNPVFYPLVPLVATLLSTAQPQTIRVTDAHWRAPALFQTAIGFERQLTRRITLSTNYLHTSGAHTLRSRNINAPLPGTGLHPYGGVSGIYLYEASGIFRQSQWTTNVSAKVGSKFTLAGAYTLGSARSDTDGIGSFPANQYDLSTEFSRAGFDIRHRLQINGSWSPKWGLRLSPFLTATSGRPYNITLGKDLNGDGLFNDRPVGVARNTGNGPGMVAANMRLAKVFLIGEKSPRGNLNAGRDPLELTFSVNARNFLNHPNYALPSGNLSSPLYGQYTALAGGQGTSGTRRLDLQVKFAF